MRWPVLFCCLAIFPFAFAQSANLKRASGYSSIVVFGASYCDNGHPRESKFSFSLRPSPYYRGRWSNGPVWVEVMAQDLGVPLFDYAYGGATVNNQLTNGGVPDTRSQIQTYLADIQSGKIQRGSGKVLHLMWVGINSIHSIWHAGQGVNRVLAEAEEVRNQFSLLLSDPTINKVPSEFHLLTLPPLQIVPNDAVYGNRYVGVANAQGGIQMLTDAYNERLISAIQNLNSQSAFVHNVASFWFSVHNTPDNYGFTHVRSPCLSYLQPCGTPAQYVYFDSLHPSARMHSLIAQWVLNSIEDESLKKKKKRIKTTQSHSPST